MIIDNTPVYNCEGCNTTGGRASCAIHGGVIVCYGDRAVVQKPEKPTRLTKEEREKIVDQVVKRLAPVIRELSKY